MAKILAKRPIWQGTGLLIYDVGHPSKSVAIEKLDINHTIFYLTRERAGTVYLADRLKIEFKPKTVELRDYQGRVLTIPHSDIKLFVALLRAKDSQWLVGKSKV